MRDEPIAAGDVVLAHLVAPTEKLLGVLLSLDVSGVGLRAINLDSFDSWVREVASGEPPSRGAATMFVPMHRIERLFRDEDVGAVEGYGSRFRRTADADLGAALRS